MKTFELVNITPYTFCGQEEYGRYFTVHNIQTGHFKTLFTTIQSKRKLIDTLRKFDVMCSHYVYR